MNGPDMPSRGSRYLTDSSVFAPLVCAVAAYVIIRAVTVPLVHDECASAVWFAQPAEWLPYDAHWDANNHFLSSGLGVLFYRLIGPDPWSLRLGSLLAFVVYAYAGWRAGHWVTNALVRWCFWGAWLLCPFVLDFFSMFRGYSIELACWALALDALLRYARTHVLQHLILALLAMVIGSAAIVALAPVWGIVLLLLAWSYGKGRSRMVPTQRRLQAIAIVVLGVLPWLGALRLSWDMKERGLLYYGSLKGFTESTVASLSRYVLGSDHPVVVAVVIAAMLGATWMAVRVWRRGGDLAAPLPILMFLLWCDVLGRVLMARLLGVNYPEDRTGIHYVPLVLLAAACAVDSMAGQKRAARWCALFLLALPARTLYTANFDHCLIWPEQSIPGRFVARAIEEQRILGRPIVIGAYHQQKLAWPLCGGAYRGSAPSVQTRDMPEAPHDLRLVDGRFLGECLPGYEVIDSAEGPGLWLLRRSLPLRPQMIDTVELPAWSGTDEFHELAVLDTALLHSRDLYLAVEVPVRFPVSSPEMVCVVQVADSTGADLRYDPLQLCAERARWNGEPLRFARTLLRSPYASRAVIYCYDPRRDTLTLGPSRVSIGVLPEVP